MKNCPCGNDKSYDECCGLFITRQKIPATPEELMRSRYSAYSKANIDYIMATMKSPAADGFDVAVARKWARNAHWVSLQVISARSENNIGYVEFIATFIERNFKQQLHELSEFHLIDGRWYYVAGTTVNKV